MKLTEKHEYLPLAADFWRSLLLIFFFVASLSHYLFASETASYATIDRIIYDDPVSSNPHSSWNKVVKHDFPWTSPEYLTGWQRRVDSKSKAGIYLSIFPTKHDLRPEEYKNSLAGTLQSDYGANLIEHSYLDISGYAAELTKFQTQKRGNGLDFIQGKIPTTAIYINVKLGKENDPSYIWPVLIIYCAAPTKYFHIIQSEFENFLENLILTPEYEEADIKRLQTYLANMGFDPGQIDGRLGPQTEQAVKQFQIDNAITAHGKLDKRTVDLLNNQTQTTQTPQYPEQDMTIELNNFYDEGADASFFRKLEYKIINNFFLILLIMIFIFNVLFLIFIILIYSTVKKQSRSKAKR